MQILLPFPLKRFERLWVWAVVFIFLKKLFSNLKKFFIEPVFLFLTKPKKKTACGLYYKYKVSIKKSLLYATSRRKKMLPVVEILEKLCFQKLRNVLRKPRNDRLVICKMQYHQLQMQMLLPFPSYALCEQWLGSCILIS